MSLFQALCLLQFNDGHEFSLQDVQDATKIGRFTSPRGLLPSYVHEHFGTTFALFFASRVALQHI